MLAGGQGDFVGGFGRVLGRGLRRGGRQLAVDVDRRLIGEGLELILAGLGDGDLAFHYQQPAPLIDAFVTRLEGEPLERKGVGGLEVELLETPRAWPGARLWFWSWGTAARDSGWPR